MKKKKKAFAENNLIIMVKVNNYGLIFNLMAAKRSPEGDIVGLGFRV